MANGEQKVDHAPDDKNKFELKDSKNTVLEGVDSDQYDVYTETAKLAKASAKQRATWFVSFLITKKGETQSTKDSLNYTVKFDKPGKDEERVQVFYYLEETDTASTRTQSSRRPRRIWAR